MAVQASSPRRRGPFSYRPTAQWVRTITVKGKPRQQHVAYLVGFKEDALWDRIEARLAELGNNISPASDHYSRAHKEDRQACQ
jgi:hypothetical protein